MNLPVIADIVLGLALVGSLCVRQLLWTAVRVRRLWRLPLVLGGVALLVLSRTSGGSLTSLDTALLLVELVVAAVTGGLMGRISVFRPIPRDAAPRLEARPGEDAPLLESRTGWLGVALWGALLLVRLGLAFAGHAVGSAVLDSTGAVLLVVAVNRAARAAVLLARMSRSGAAVAAR